MSRVVKLALIIGISATIAIAEPNQAEITEVQQGSNSVTVAESRQGETLDGKEAVTGQPASEDEIKQADISLVKEQLRTELHENRADDLKCALEIIVVSFIVFIGYAIIKREREYKAALAETKEKLKEIRDAGKEARASADKARDWEDKAKEKFDQIDEKVKEKLELIEKTSQEQTEEQAEKISAEAEEERKISKLWSEGLRALTAKDFRLADEKFEKIVENNPNDDSAYYNWGLALGELAKRTQDKGKAEKLLRQAIEKFQKAIEINPDDDDAYYNWGAALIYLAKRTQDKGDAEKLLGQAIEKFQKATGIKPNSNNAYNNWGAALTDLAIRTQDKGEAEKLLGQAIEKFQKATEINPNDDSAYNNWGAALMYLAKYKTGTQQKTLLDEAEEKSLKAESIKKGSGSYNLGCIYALRGNKGKCKEWLEKSEKYGSMATREHAEGDDDLKSVRDEEWFKKLRWK